MIKSIGKYKIEKLLGKGAMGEVYLGRDETLDRFVAIKVLQGSAEFTTAFLEEARLCAKLEHPNILKIFELGKVEESGRLYCVMQYIDGGSLTELIKNKGVLSEAEVLAISRGVLSGLQCAHKAGIIHRDIKPDNILFDRNGFPIIADFGIAQNLNNVFTLNKQIIGTPEYMSPEQAQGLDLNSRTDIYSFGVVMFQMATGRLPFCAETPLELALKHVNDTAPSPLAINRSMNPELAKIIIKSSLLF